MARSKKSESGDARERLLQAAGRGFRTGGFGGIGVDGLAREAGLTSGAFYAHFGSKADAFRLAVVDGIKFLRGGVAAFRESHGRGWRDPFVDYYFGERMLVSLAEACALPSFTPDVARADDATRVAYQDELRLLLDEVAGGFGGSRASERAWALLSILSGAAGMARAVKDEKTRRDILASARAAAKAV
ncbi:MAG: hypothetical protein A4S14_14175 [Proteobacteria bacterium SG_bin9]|nr:MAG: hypothetical protein A4S14_14175 [Proteobacteria bacterium SG_bin9]